MPEDHNKSITHSFADLMKQDEDFQIFNNLDDREITTLTIAYDETVKHSILYKHD